MIDESKLVKYLSGEMTGEELNEVEQWLAMAENKAEFEKLKQLWEGTSEIANESLFNADKSWGSMQQRINTSPSRKLSKERTLFPYWAAAASVILLLGISAIFFFQRNHTKEHVFAAQSEKMATPVLLPDGSKVYLNRNTSLTYNEDFNKKGRNVTLTGEAFFEVAKNPAQPFVIHTGKADVRVIGTSFNVMAYQNCDSVLVMVKSGIVELYSNQNSAEKIELTVGKAGTYFKSEEKITTRPSYDANMLAWKTNQLNFRNSDLQYVSDALSRAFGKEITCDKNKLNNCRLNANFNNQPLDVILKVIQESLNLQVEQTGSTYKLTGPGC